jgi:uncharacterized membrane protein (UPF0127 family)
MDSNSKRIIPLFEGYCKQTNVDNIDVKCRLGSLPMTLKVASTPESQSMGYQNSDKEMVHRETMQSNTYPKTYHCPVPVQYAVETKAGWYDRNGEKDLKLHL